MSTHWTKPASVKTHHCQTGSLRGRYTRATEIRAATAEEGMEGIEVAPHGTYSMGTAPLGEPLTLIFRLRNPDVSQPMKIRSFQADAQGFAVEPPVDTIPAGDTVPFRVTLLAEEAGTFSLPIGIYLETDPVSDIDPLVNFQISGKVIGPDGE